MCTDMPDSQPQTNLPVTVKDLSKTPSFRAKRAKFNIARALDLRRFFMPNVDKIVKTVMHEISEGKTAVREIMFSSLKNQEIIIAQNKCITNLLAEINDKLSSVVTRNDSSESDLESEKDNLE